MKLKTFSKSVWRSLHIGWHRLVAGLILTSGLALFATLIQGIPGFSLFSPLILAVLLGILARNMLGVSQIFQPGITFSLKRILRLAIILLGLQLSISQLIEVGSAGLTIVAITLVSTFVFTCWLGRQLGVSKKLTQLIATGTSICGASAIVAINTIVDTTDEDVAYGIAIVTVFGTFSMLLYPLFPIFLHLTPEAFGIWCGTSIHEVAQVVAAAFQNGHISGEIATISKLSRLIFLAPLMGALVLLSMRFDKKAKHIKLNQLPIPWIVLGFFTLTLFNSLDIIPLNFKEWVVESNRFLLTIALAAMGLETNLSKMKQSGFKPLYLGAAAWLFISVLSLSLIKVFY